MEKEVTFLNLESIFSWIIINSDYFNLESYYLHKANYIKENIIFILYILSQFFFFSIGYSLENFLLNLNNIVVIIAFSFLIISLNFKEVVSSLPNINLDILISHLLNRIIAIHSWLFVSSVFIYSVFPLSLNEALVISQKLVFFVLIIFGLVSLIKTTKLSFKDKFEKYIIV